MTLIRISTNQLQFLNIQEIIKYCDTSEVELIIIPKTMSEDRVSRIWGEVLQSAWIDTKYNITFIVICDDKVAERFGIRHTHGDKYDDITYCDTCGSGTSKMRLPSEYKREHKFKTRMREFANRFKEKKGLIE